jgi:hypothetical protein
MRLAANVSTVFQYWFGPSRNTELLRRMPSISSTLRKPVKPRMNGEPCPLDVFCTSTPGTSPSASGSVRDWYRPRMSAADTEYAMAGTANARMGSRVAVTMIDSSSSMSSAPTGPFDSAARAVDPAASRQTAEVATTAFISFSRCLRAR